MLSGGIVTSARLASPSSVRPEGGSPQKAWGDFPTPLRMHKHVAPLSKMMFGINRYKVIKAALKAMHVIPRVPAIVGNGGAWLFGARSCPRATTWQAAQMLRAISAPRREPAKPQSRR